MRGLKIELNEMLDGVMIAKGKEEFRYLRLQASMLWNIHASYVEHTPFICFLTYIHALVGIETLG